MTDDPDDRIRGDTPNPSAQPNHLISIGQAAIAYHATQHHSGTLQSLFAASEPPRRGKAPSNQLSVCPCRSSLEAIAIRTRSGRVDT